jgi:hypothetical protein
MIAMQGGQGFEAGQPVLITNCSEPRKKKRRKKFGRPASFPSHDSIPHDSAAVRRKCEGSPGAG